MKLILHDDDYYRIVDTEDERRGEVVTPEGIVVLWIIKKKEVIK